MQDRGKSGPLCPLWAIICLLGFTKGGCLSFTTTAKGFFKDFIKTKGLTTDDEADMMETEPGTVNNELRQDYIPTNNILRAPALCLQCFCFKELVAKVNVSMCLGQSGWAPGGSSPPAET